MVRVNICTRNSHFEGIWIWGSVTWRLGKNTVGNNWNLTPMLRIYSGAVVRERVGYDGLDHHFLHFLRSIRHLCLSLSLSLRITHERTVLPALQQTWMATRRVRIRDVIGHPHGAREIGGSHEWQRICAVREPCLSGWAPTFPLELAQKHFYKVRILIHKSDAWVFSIFWSFRTFCTSTRWRQLKTHRHIQWAHMGVCNGQTDFALTLTIWPEKERYGRHTFVLFVS